MSGIYIHIPFCLSKCAYCGFYSIPSLKRKNEFLEALKQEIVLRKDYLHGWPVGTIYFGGGTPSILKVEEIGTLLHLIKEHFDVEVDPEITLEANPDTLSPEYLSGLREIGVNRLSIGIQSFFDNDLQYLSRRHNSQHARQCVSWAKAAGFENISLDLIYGLPTSDADQWNRNLDCFFAMEVPHLSAYALTLEPNSILTKQIEMGKALPVNEDDAVRDYELLCRRASENGFLHYEISNFCKPGMHSRHNSNYWFGIPYLGLGPSAHSYDRVSRQWNDSHLENYLCDFPFEMESLCTEQRYDEYVMLRLRTIWGIDLKYLKREMGERLSSYCEKKAQPLIVQGRLSQTREFLYLNDSQMLFADGIAEELFW
ncbi:MAG: radical SAM family heme chaperone HemW [Bacteroidales bacterium]|nr:radical SAM family heme chaperone HemW [Bacteroidales bacterium]